LTTFHKEALTRKINTSKQPLLNDVKSEDINSFNKKLCLGLISVNIPWTKLKNPIFRNFFYKSIVQNLFPMKAFFEKIISVYFTMKPYLKLETLLEIRIFSLLWMKKPTLLAVILQFY
jgi:hypothetical protein